MLYIIDLNVVEGWPPVEAESLHFNEVSNGYKVKSIPFFIENVAYDDVLELDILDETRAAIKSTVTKSENSTVWVYFREGVNEKEVLRKLKKLKIGVEGGALKGYYSLNIPKELSLQDFDNQFEDLEKNGFVEIAYGALRHL